jgi:hypothetical protein
MQVVAGWVLRNSVKGGHSHRDEYALVNKSDLRSLSEFIEDQKND